MPLILGLAGMIAFFVIERFWVKFPTVPVEILGNRTTALGYVATFLHAISVMAAGE